MKFSILAFPAFGSNSAPIYLPPLQMRRSLSATANEYDSGLSHLGRKSFVAMSASIGRFFKIPATSMTSAAAFNARSVIRPSRL